MLSGNGPAKDREFSVSPAGSLPAYPDSPRDFDAEATEDRGPQGEPLFRGPTRGR
jgi:hypothetical protein